jgi:hypothetical protein
MPTTTLCVAIIMDRRPIRTASATRSIRSTVMTASALCDEAVAACAPIANAHVGHRERRSVVDAIADHHHGAEPRLLANGPHVVELVGGRQLGIDRSRSSSCMCSRCCALLWEVRMGRVGFPGRGGATRAGMLNNNLLSEW